MNVDNTTSSATWQSSSTATSSTTASSTSKTSTTNETTSKANPTGNETAGVYEKSTETKGTSKEKYVVDRKAVDQMIRESKTGESKLKKLIEGLVRKQAGKNAVASGASISDEFNNLLFKIKSGKNAYVEIDAETRAQAKEDIAEGGYYSVEKTAERILGFAKAISGGDPSKIPALKKAVEKGFEAAEKAWGGKLPQISQDTYDTVMKGFDEWEASAKA